MNERSVEELMEAPSALAVYDSARDAMMHRWEEMGEWLVRTWKCIKRTLLNVIRNGTRLQRRTAWKLLHPPRKLKRSYRRLQVARRRALDQVT